MKMPSSKKSRLIIIPALLLLASGLGGCGVKPNRVEAPPGDHGALFPRTYPTPDADE